MATFIEKLFVLPTIGLVLAKTLTAAVTAPITGTYDSPSYGEYVMNSGVRAFLGSFRVSQIQWILPKFPETYQTWCGTKKIKPDAVTITGPSGEDIPAFWVGDKAKAKYHMVYYHGGGWAMPGSDAHLNMLEKWVKWSGDKLAVLCVSYTLSPKVVYPTSLGQCVEGLRYLLEVQGCSPSNVLLGGDSAGGGLVLSVLSHALHPHPNSTLVKPLKLSSPLFGAISVDPWISADVSRYKSFTTRQHRDTFPLAAMYSWADNYKGSSADDNYIWPARAEADWWTGTPCKRLLATVGEHEILSDSVIDWGQKYRVGAGQGSIDMVVGVGETHICSVLSPKSEVQLLGPDEKGQEKAIMVWIKKTLK